MFESDPEVLAAFAEEAVERLDSLEAALLELERVGSGAQPDLLNAMFRDAHSIKAAANLLHLNSLVAASHRLENVLDCLRKGQLSPGPGVVQALLDGADLLREMVGRPEAPPPADMPSRLAALASLALCAPDVA